MEKGHIFLLDGSNLLFQMFYGMPSRIIGRQGRPIHGTVGFVGALMKMLRWVKPTHVAVLFDGEYTSQRAELDTEYKANRTDYSQMELEETPFSQLPDICAVLDRLGIRHCETTECEVDDWIAAYALRYGRDYKVTIASQDSDYFQLITDTVRVLRYRGEKSQFCDRGYIQEKLHIEPGQYADHKALTGDAADNIRGADKIGPKTAAALLAQFGSLQNLLSNTDQVARPSVRAALGADPQRLLRNYQLIRLEDRAALPFLPEQLCWQDPGKSSTQLLGELGIR